MVDEKWLDPVGGLSCDSPILNSEQSPVPTSGWLVGPKQGMLISVDSSQQITTTLVALNSQLSLKSLFFEIFGAWHTVCILNLCHFTIVNMILKLYILIIAAGIC